MRLAIFSDIHEDLNSLKRVLNKIDQKGCDMRICLGDISGYNESFNRYAKTRNASACLELIRSKCDIIVPGNHDLHAAGRLQDHKDKAHKEFWSYEEDLNPGYDDEEISFLAGLPEHTVLPASGYKILLSHYIEPNLTGLKKEFYSHGSEFGIHFQLMQKLQCKLGFAGHAHIRGFYTAAPERFRHYPVRRILRIEFPSVIGIPPVTRFKNRARFCIFDTDTYLLKIFKLF